MKLNHNKIEIDSFKQVIDQCKGDVWIETDFGDHISLKSQVSQMIGLSALITDTDREWSLYCADSAEEPLFFKFFETYGV